MFKSIRQHAASHAVDARSSCRRANLDCCWHCSRRARLSKGQLEASLYEWGGALESNAIEVHIHHVRKKLGTDMVVTMRGVGYFVPSEPKS